MVTSQTTSDQQLIRFTEAPWAYWRWVGLRGAGFPARLALQLALPGAAHAADAYLDAEDTYRHTHEQALALLRQELEHARPEQRDLVKKAARNLQKGKLPASLPTISPQTQTALEAFRADKTRLEAARLDFAQTFEQQTLEQSRKLQTLACMDRLREAVLWQNHHAFYSGIAQLARTDTPRWKRRQYEQLVANYVQRYCVKNDTIGFFGPVGWLQLEERQSEPITMQLGAELLKKRNIYFESWCIDELATVLGQNRELKRWMIPRRVPTIYIEKNQAFLPFGSVLQLLPVQAIVLQACDGEKTAQEIAEKLVKQPRTRLRHEREVYSILEFLKSKGLILWNLDVPFTLHPEQALRQNLLRITDPQLRKAAMSPLDELELARDAIAQAAGNVELLGTALTQLDAVFTRLTGNRPTHMQGKVYAGRNIVFEDCQRDIEIRLGPDVYRNLEQPLDLLLTAARWFTFEVAQRYRTIFQRIYHDLAAQYQAPTIPMVQFWSRAQVFITDKNEQGPQNAVKLEFQDRWAKILAFDPQQSHVNCSSQELRSRVQELFAAPHAGWAAAHCHSPDILLEASSIEAIHRGDYQLVMGELHIAQNTMSSELFVAQHPAREELQAALKASLPQGLCVPVVPKNWSRVTSRALYGLVAADDFRLVFTPDACGVSAARALPIGELVVEEQSGRVVARTRDGQHCFDMLEVFANMLSLLVIDKFGLLRQERHTPRIAIDRLVVCREAWRYPARELTFAEETTEAERFRAARCWMRKQQLPRFVFVKIPSELKPFYVDFESPVLLEILAKAIRHARSEQGESLVAFSEMLPGHEKLWLSDAQGEKYTAELRFVVVNQAEAR